MFLVRANNYGYFFGNACVSRSACVGHLCAIKGAKRAAHKRTTRALSAARNCYAHIISNEPSGLVNGTVISCDADILFFLEYEQHL